VRVVGHNRVGFGRFHDGRSLPGRGLGLCPRALQSLDERIRPDGGAVVGQSRCSRHPSLSSGKNGKTVREILNRAESLWRAGRYDDAWLAIEELEPIDRVTSIVVGLRLRICHSSRNWRSEDDLS
jgi:hypothetical protein